MQMRKVGNSRRPAIASLLCAIAMMDRAHSDVYATTQNSTWIGSFFDSNWSTASNWTPSNSYPNNGNGSISDYNVIINGPFLNPVLDVPATIDSLTLNSGTMLILSPSQTLNVNGPTISNGGTIQIDEFSGDADLNITANTSLTGSGTVLLDDGSTNNTNPNAQLSTAPGATLTNGATQTINGLGAIDAAIINNGIINANMANEALLLGTYNITNNNTMEATNGGVLQMHNITVTQGISGVISAAGGNVVVTKAATIAGGTLVSTATTSIQMSLNSTLSNVTISSGTTVLVDPSATANLSGSTITNNGSIVVDQLVSNADLNISSNLLLSGSGTLMLLSNSPGARLTASPGVTLTNDVNETIGGFGDIDTPVINNGKILASAATMFAHSLNINGKITGTGSLTVGAGALMTFGTNTGSSSQDSLSIASNGTLDITNNHLFINYTSGADPIASIAAWITSGYNHNAWNGLGIISTTAKNNSASYGIGYADSADPGNPAGLASYQIEIKYTLLGDANLDGAVNGTDFAILAMNFNQSVNGWDKGDFNYDGSVNGTDFAFLASNFNLGASQADTAALDAFAAANGLMTDVPEPVSAGTMVLIGIELSTLKRRRR